MSLPRLQDISFGNKPYTMNIIWTDGSQGIADFYDIILDSIHFCVFLDDIEEFKKCRIINWGHGIEWENGLDFSADSIKELTLKSNKYIK